MASQTQLQLLSDMLEELSSVTELELLAAHLKIEQSQLEKIKCDYEVSMCMHNKNGRDHLLTF